MYTLVNWELAKLMGYIFFFVAILLAVIVGYVVFKGSRK